MTEAQLPKPDVSTRLAIERTRVAYDRTMMSWIRTGTSLITFGFTIYKHFQIMTRSPNYAAADLNNDLGRSKS